MTANLLGWTVRDLMIHSKSFFPEASSPFAVLAETVKTAHNKVCRLSEVIRSRGLKKEKKKIIAVESLRWVLSKPSSLKKAE